MDADDVEVRVGPTEIVIHADDRFLVTDPDGAIRPDARQGFFAADTRLVSAYDFRINGARPIVLNSSASSTVAARYELTNRDLMSRLGTVHAHTLHARIDRSLRQVLHEDLLIVNYAGQTIAVVLEIRIHSDFADLFDVKAGHVSPRGALSTEFDGRELRTDYRNQDFERSIAIRVESSSSPVRFANGALTFHVEMEPRERWCACVRWIPIIDGETAFDAVHPCHALEPTDVTRVPSDWSRLETSDARVSNVVTRATNDLAALRIHSRHHSGIGSSPDPWVPAAGVPWFVTLFGRDALVVALQTVALAPRLALGTLDALSALQADRVDAWRDMEPGKIEHEIRHGELAALRLVPQLPYYGSHDAPALFVRAAAESWRWHGDRAALDHLRPHVTRALGWIEDYGDLDQDGLQEYRTRSSQGYYNQSWKDSDQAIVHADGTRATLPIATCELQGYVVRAKEAWAHVLDSVYHEAKAATTLRDDAARLREAIETRFWWEDEGTYYLGLDGSKQPIASVSSNPGHLLWCGAILPERAAQVAARLAADDMWTGWGVRTLSSHHPAYNPFSYQLGSVWPHDNSVLVAGLLEYGLDSPAGAIARGLFDAAVRFDRLRLPEVFAGLARDPGSFPVQYLGANVPQAWASGAVLQMITSFLGLVPDSGAGTLVVMPRLPRWLDRIAVRNLGVGDARVDIVTQRRADSTHVDVTVTRGTLEVIHGASHPSGLR